MKSISQSFNWLIHLPIHHPLAFTIISSILFFSAGLYGLILYNQRAVNAELEATTKRVEALWRAVTTAHEETMKAYFNQYVMNPETLKILKRANSEDPNQRVLARTELFRTLWDSYRYLSSNLFVRQFHFHLPNNRSFLRFHAPAHHDDDLTEHRPTVALTNKLKKPHFSFETGRVITGYRYVFPIIDRENNHLGSVELSRPFEALRKSLNEIERDAGFKLLLRESVLMPKILPPYRKYYTPVSYLSGWVVEDPYGELHDSPKPLKDEFAELLNSLKDSDELKELFESSENKSIKASRNGKYYTVTAIKLRELGSEVVAATLIAISPSKIIAIEMESFRRRLIAWIVIILVLSTITFLHLKQSSLMRLKKIELEAITSSMGSGLAIVDEQGRIRFINESGQKILGMTQEELLGKVFHDAVHRHVGDKESCPIHLSILNRTKQNLETELVRKDGDKIDVILITSPLFVDDSYVGAVIVFMDISERKALEKHLYNLSVTDSLTSLYNRRFQTEVLLNAKNNFERYGTPFSILMLDIDNFKQINDTFGHNVGDEVLKAISKSLLANLRSSDVPSRWGGEEFLVLLQNTELQSAEAVAERIRRDIENLSIYGVGRVTVSVGVASYRKGESIESLVTRADDAMYEAKASGKNRVVVSR